jgi:hypothetical protein
MSQQGEGPAAPDLALLQQEYETSKEPLRLLGQRLGVTSQSLSSLAKRYGWKLRKERFAAKLVKGARAKNSIERLKSVLSAKIARLDAEMADDGKPDNEKHARTANLLVRTLEKVIELERKDRAERARARKQRTVVDDATRERLARKLEAIHLGRPYPG